LVTLFFILAMMAIVSTSLSLISKNFENSDDESMKLQLMLSGKDLIKILKDSKEINDINTTQDMKDFLSVASFVPLGKVGLFDEAVSISSAEEKINFAKMARWTSKQKEHLKEYLMEYGVVDPSFFLHIIEDLTGKKRADRVFLTEAVYAHPEWVSAAILDWMQFYDILDYYILQTDDYAICRVPWRNIARFSSYGGVEADINFATPDVWHFIFPDMDKEQIVAMQANRVFEKWEDLPFSKEQTNIIRQFIKIDEHPTLFHIKVVLRREQKSIAVSFDYDIKKKKIYDTVYNY